jgi:type IX secretion system PorP/SprF family membrane protein
MKKFIISLMIMQITLVDIPCALSQDVYYSQFFNVPVYYNPAFTGINKGVKARFVYRNLWPKLPVSYKSYYFSAEIGDRGLPGTGGIGLYVNSNNDGIAFIHDLSAGLNVSVRIPLTEYMESQFGIKAGFGQRRVNWDDFVMQDQLSALYGFIGPSDFIAPDANKKVYPDFGAGGLVLFASEQINMTGTLGFAVDHLFQPDIAFLSNGEVPLYRKLVIHGEAIFSLGQLSSGNSSFGIDDPLKINPGILYQTQNGLSALQIGLNLLKFNIYLGGWYKTALGAGNTSAFSMLAGYRYNMNNDIGIKFCYSYDMQITGSLSGTGGAHEVSFILEFGNATITGVSGRDISGNGGVYRAPTRSGRGALECPSF